MIRIRPTQVRSCLGGSSPGVVFEVPHRPDLFVDIPCEEVGIVEAAFRGRGARPSLWDLWNMTNLYEGQFTEVIVEPVGEEPRFWLVLVSCGAPSRLAVQPVDAMLFGFHYNLPFFIPEPEVPDRLPDIADSPKFSGAITRCLRLIKGAKQR